MPGVFSLFRKNSAFFVHIFATSCQRDNRERFLKRGGISLAFLAENWQNPFFDRIFHALTVSPQANLTALRRQLAEAQRQFNALEMRPNESLRDFEYRVKRHSDKILSLKVAEQVQQQQIEQEAREAEERLKKKIL